MTETSNYRRRDSLPLPPLSLFWPVALVAGMEKAKADLALRNLEFIQEEIKLHGGLKAKVASPNVVRLDLRTMVLRDYGRPAGFPTLVNAPFAGHRANSQNRGVQPHAREDLTMSDKPTYPGVQTAVW